MLFLTGWIQYADTSINVSLSQRRDLAAEGPILEVPDGRGGWKTAIAPMGYPAGKTKTMPVDLSAVLDRSDPRVRIRTNLAIYWDRIVYTVDDDPEPLRLTPAPLLSASLFERGFSRMTRASAESPHVFVHDDVAGGPRWADMAGRYTRLGEVRELLLSADDRYVVMKGGDAVRLVFDGSGAAAAARWLGPGLALRLRRMGQGRRQEHGRRADGGAPAVPRDGRRPLRRARVPGEPGAPRSSFGST